MKEYIKLSKLQVSIIKEIVKSMKLLGAKSDLIGSINSWGDCQTDEETLLNIKAWNNSNTKQ